MKCEGIAYKRYAIALFFTLVICVLLCAMSGCAITADTENQEDELGDGLVFDEATQRDVGLLIAPADSTEVEVNLEDLFGSDMITAINKALTSLSLTNSDATVVYNADGTLRYGASLVYLSEEDTNLSLEVTMNPDNAVITGDYYYIDEDPFVDSSSEQFGKQSETIPDFISPNNTVDGVDLWLGHTVQYGADEEGNKIELDIYVASFSFSGNNYVVESVGISQTEFLGVISAMLEVT